MIVICLQNSILASWGERPLRSRLYRHASKSILCSIASTLLFGRHRGLRGSHGGRSAGKGHQTAGIHGPDRIPAARVDVAGPFDYVVRPFRAGLRRQRRHVGIYPVRRKRARCLHRCRWRCSAFHIGLQLASCTAVVDAVRRFGKPGFAAGQSLCRAADPVVRQLMRIHAARGCSGSCRQVPRIGG